MVWSLRGLVATGTLLLALITEAYASVSGSAISGGTASEYGVEQISNMASGGYRERFSPLVDRVPTAFFG